MMRMVMTSPNVLKNRRPDWLAPFNFFFFPLLSDLGGYPFGFDKTNFQLITPPEMVRMKWSKLKGINLLDGLTYQISMVPDPNQTKVIPDSFRISVPPAQGQRFRKTDQRLPSEKPLSGGSI